MFALFHHRTSIHCEEMRDSQLLLNQTHIHVRPLNANYLEVLFGIRLIRCLAYVGDEPSKQRLLPSDNKRSIRVFLSPTYGAER